MARLSIDLDKLIELYQSGMSASDVAKELGCSLNTVLRRLKENNIEVRDSGHYKIGTKASDETRKKMSEGISKAVRKSGRFLQQEVPCENCGRLVMKHNRDLKRNANQFCSHECYSVWKKTISGEEHPLYDRIEHVCEQCGGEFLTHPYRLERSEKLFCSKECHNDWMYENQQGENNPNWKGGTTKWPERGSSRRDYRELRDEIFERDKHMCTDCGSKNNLEIHHIKQWSLYPELWFDRDNCRTLCTTCHIEADKIDNESL
ncbi:helix-turn-helix domain-containing protein [Sporosarcina newyorkensis]|nr:helix-turn-helix domain-containing protein [Sporosarcina newyorkensis]